MRAGLHGVLELRFGTTMVELLRERSTAKKQKRAQLIARHSCSNRGARGKISSCLFMPKVEAESLCHPRQSGTTGVRMDRDLAFRNFHMPANSRAPGCLIEVVKLFDGDRYICR